MPTWLQLSFKAPPEALDTVSNFLLEKGSPGVVLEKNGVRAFFPLTQAKAGFRRDVQSFHRALWQIYPALSSQSLRWTLLKDKNWKNSWRRFFAPLEVGESLWIAPPWAKRSAPARRRAITIEPGMAFGTGNHFTTRTCLEFIEQTAALFAPGAYAALDVGTGSGILAIALAKLKAGKVLALDVDPIAVKVATSNVRRNRVRRIVAVRGVGLDMLSDQFHIVVANLTAETLIELARKLQQTATNGGYLILSGILRPKAKAVARAFRAMTLVRKKSDKEWSTLLLRKKG
ncbi:MAG: 50S ribosomal protein L11 methyltransferase [Candidatus Binatia bacterium]